MDLPWLLRMTLLVSLLMTPPVIYLCWRLYTTSKELFKNHSWVKKALPVVLLSFFIYPICGLIDFYVTGGIDVLQYPKPLVYWFWFGLVFVFQLLSWVIIADVIKLGSRYFKVGNYSVIYAHALSVVLLSAIIFLFTTWKVYSNTTGIVSDQVELSIDKLPPALKDFKIVHISDVQGDEYTGEEQIAEYVQQINEQSPDLIVFTGDLISYGTDFINMAARELGKAKATYGTVAVIGDHDYWAGVPEVEQALTEQGISLLKNENHSIVVDSTASMMVTGVTEVYSEQVDPMTVDSLTSENSHPVKIFASHQVADHLITSARENNYQLLLAGHTHGGQVRVPFMGMTFSASELETKFVSDVYHEDGLLVNINNGLGFTLAPIRFNAFPSISVITLKEK